jgi:hypothetical protein
MNPVVLVAAGFFVVSVSVAEQKKGVGRHG